MCTTQANYSLLLTQSNGVEQEATGRHAAECVNEFINK